jgi:cysteinyl-tRNA synthetase
MNKESITLSQALKRKTRLAGEIKRLEKAINENNSRNEKVPIRLDIKAMMEDLIKTSRELARVKAAISSANAGQKNVAAGIYPQVHLMAEIRNLLKFLRQLKTTEGPQNANSYGDPFVEIMIADITQDKAIQLANEFQVEIEKLQDEVDYYNLTSKVNIAA